MPSLLFLILIIQLIGFTAYFEVSHYLIRKEVKSIIKQGVSEENRIIFTFNSSELKALQWVKKNEFRLGRRMYDVIEKSTLSTGEIEFQCISDIQEERLFANLSFTVSRNMGDDHHQTPFASLFKILVTPALLNDLPSIVKTTLMVEIAKHYFTYSSLSSDAYLGALEQPPCSFC